MSSQFARRRRDSKVGRSTWKSDSDIGYLRRILVIFPVNVRKSSASGVGLESPEIHRLTCELNFSASMVDYISKY